MEQRLNILHEGKVIDGDIKEICLLIHNNIFVDRGLNNRDAYVTLMTHLAMAAQRIKEKKPVDPMDKMIIDELKTQSRFDEATEINALIQEYFDFELPNEELDYISLHLLNVLQEENND